MKEVLLATIAFAAVFAVVYTLGMLYWGDRDSYK